MTDKNTAAPKPTPKEGLWRQAHRHHTEKLSYLWRQFKGQRDSLEALNESLCSIRNWLAASFVVQMGILTATILDWSL